MKILKTEAARFFRHDPRGNVVTIFAIAFPVLAIAVSAGFELEEVQTAKTELQAAVDSAAVKGARELMTDQSSATPERARIFSDELVNPLRTRWTITTTAKADLAQTAVTVSQTAWRPSFFQNLLPPGGFHLNVTATAQANSSVPLCVLTLQENAGPTMNLMGTAAMKAPGCLVQSDSAILATGPLQAAEVRSVGAAEGSISPKPITDAPSISDPFAAMPINVPPHCDDNGITLVPFTETTLKPGVHCGPIVSVGAGSLLLLPGEHYFVDSSLIMTGDAEVKGTDVVVVLKGVTIMKFLANAGLNLEGRRSGPYAGFVLVTDRSYTGTVLLETTSAHKLLGTIYLPNATLTVAGANNKIADQSPWTVVVAKQLLAIGAATLMINSAYFSAAVPVPSGVGPSGVQITR